MNSLLLKKNSNLNFIIVGDPISTRDDDISLYITGCKPQPHEPVLWG